ncbi:MAG: phosphoribosylamine--glycine ligase [Candidatus Promineifilaceae bacterium]|jgi:phosphoribosylamine--glycine ligase
MLIDSGTIRKHGAFDNRRIQGMDMRILVVGGGGREHTLVWKLSSDATNPEIFCAPGNAGTAQLATNIDIGAEDIDALVAWAVENRPDLTVIGPEAPLCAGLSDALASKGLRAFGPNGEAAMLEGSKAFAKEIMFAAGVPTAESETFTDIDAALAYVREKGAPIVVKAEGLAAGKGVLLCDTVEDAEAGLRDAMQTGIFGDAGKCVVIEAFLFGEEASILALVDGETIVMLDSSQDHKRALDGDRGLNTGGMGAYSPAPVVTPERKALIQEVVLERTLAELKRRDITFKGVLYAGLMITEDGPKVLEFNVRFGDPETQALLMRMSNDLVPVLNACIDGTLSPDMLTWHDAHAACVVMAAGGYPGAYEKGDTISGLDAAAADDTVVFHAGTALEDGNVVTSGGRVLGVTAMGDDLKSALDKAYKAVDQIQFKDAHYRRDIGARAL